jgi:hypothetical protein
MVVHGQPAISLTSIIFGLVLIVLDLLIAMRFLQDLYQPERRVIGGDKSVWAVIIVFGSFLGWTAYLLIGRES